MSRQPKSGKDPRSSRKNGQRDGSKRRTHMRRRAILIAVPVALIALIVGVISGSPDSNQAAVTKQKPTAAELQQIKEKQLAREDKGIDQVLDYTTFVAAGQGKKRQVALTFDDGPSVFTPEILRILKRTGTQATFFVVGSMIPDQEKMIPKIMREGNAIGNHTQDHPHMGDLSAGDQLLQLNEQATLMAGAGGPVERLFRPPYRSFNGSTLELLAERDLLMVLWDVDTGDYEGLSSDEIARHAVDDAKPGSIILMHDGGGDRTNTVAALPEIIKGLKRRKLEPVTVPHLVLDDPPTDTTPLPEGLSGS